MKAVLYEKRHQPDTLVVHEIEKPTAGEGEVLVRIMAVSINAMDYRSMQLGLIPKNKIFGADIAGQVEAVGVHCQKFKIGDEVFGDIAGSGFGGFAQYAAVPEKFLVLKPAEVSFDFAAALPVAGITALQALRDEGRIQARQKVLIYGAGGGVGTFAIQLAKFYGTNVTAVCSQQNMELARSLGADQVLDYSRQDFRQSDQRYNLILGVNGNRSLLAYKQALTPDGVCVMVGGALIQVILSLLFGKLLSSGGRSLKLLSARTNPSDLEFLVELVADGKLKPVIDRRYPLVQTAEAMAYVRQGHTRGKVILLPHS